MSKRGRGDADIIKGLLRAMLLLALVAAVVVGIIVMLPKVVSGTLVTHARLSFAPEAGSESPPIGDPVLPDPGAEGDASALPAPADDADATLASPDDPAEPPVPVSDAPDTDNPSFVSSETVSVRPSP